MSESELEITGILDASREMGHCKHCGNFTLMLNRKIYNYNDDHELTDALIDEEGNESKVEDTPDALLWLIQECFVCKKLTLKERRIYYEDDPNCYNQDEILYPITKTPSYSLPST